jgi:hypothetical protein
LGSLATREREIWLIYHVYAKKKKKKKRERKKKDVAYN